MIGKGVFTETTLQGSLIWNLMCIKSAIDKKKVFNSCENM